MKTMFMIMMCLTLFTAACIEDGPLPTEETPDAAVPPTEPDACPTPTEDATVTPTPDATVVNPEDADITVPVPDATVPAVDASVPTPTPDATPVSPDASCPPPACVTDSDCADGYVWTGDACSAGTCVNWPIDCGGMQVRPSVTAVSCQFWAGYGTPEPAPSLGTFVLSSLPVGAAGGDWKAAPTSACSVKCYNSAGAEVLLDTQTEWNGATFLHQLITSLLKGTWDGHNTY